MDGTQACAKADVLLEQEGRQERGAEWRLRINLLTDEIEDKNEALLLQVDRPAKEDDIDERPASRARELLRPRKEKPPQTA